MCVFLGSVAFRLVDAGFPLDARAAKDLVKVFVPELQVPEFKTCGFLFSGSKAIF